MRISPFACPSRSRLFSANTGPVLHFTKTHQLSALCFVRSGHQEMLSFQSSSWEMAPSTRDAVTQSGHNVAFHSWHSQTSPSTLLAINRNVRSANKLPYSCICVFLPTSRRLRAEGVGRPFCFYNMETAFSQCDEHHLTIPCLSILSI